MFDLIKEAKENKHGVVFKEYQMPEITWEEILRFVFEESTGTGQIAKDLQAKVDKMNNLVDFISIGNVQIQEKLWLSPQTSKLFGKFNGVSELLYKLNESKENQDCGLYKQQSHDCNLDWHYQGIRISLGNRWVGDHHDPHDIFYWQIVGTSFWKIDNDVVHELNPGDLLYLPLENSHQVYCDGPRAGLLIDNWSNVKPANQ
jgi:mannose-6-phosphate isomerase-like protein (cupin superfamily)